MQFDSRAFRDALGCFATGVAIITTRHADGQPEGVTVNSFASVSLDPPLVLFSLDRKARCFDCLHVAEHYAVHVLRADQADLSSAFATKGGVPWERIAWSPGMTGCPILPGALATLECAVHARHDGGDHVILVGRVLNLRCADGDPLLYFRGRYRATAPIPAVA
ncbi:MAG: flavin reductase family protein [Alphaproteobacteria bacterium]|nr:flavin reductase family protein [Alphaproteobacteria bacterium]